ncbi:DUF4145 domain-containing protein [Dictyobacter arantiisoli]|uniref:DUF4145 domain-containing protein n=1 Tax=Dictyobacter arantiisoli TaxID=2014874 RepID=A0A5A5TLB8_9CHLR|nr:DUF4145 domain-containing protein [Dictyobacter arantiisoli]GCF11946.1 hypothetical protein KDI_55100 [Dictyobacter arantiisoli]
MENNLVQKCFHCGNTTVLSLEGEYIEEEELATNIFYVQNYLFLKCVTCIKPTVQKIEKTVSRRFYLGEGDEPLVNEKLLEGEEVITTIVYPNDSINITPEPSEDMPSDIKKDFEEARAAFYNSPRSSAALLRLCVQKLCMHLGQPGKNINQDIAALVRQGLPTKIQQSLDIVRVIGNNAVHPGEIDVQDHPDTVLLLFRHGSK